MRKLLKNTLFFRAFETKDFKIVINALEAFNTLAGQTIIKLGYEGDMLFIVSSGEYECFKIISGQNKYLKTYFCG